MVRLCMAHLWNNVYFTARVSCRGPNCSFPKVRCTCLRDIATGHTPLQCKFLPCLFNCAGQHTIECWGDNFLMSMVQVSFILVSALEANRIEAQITILIQAVLGQWSQAFQIQMFFCCARSSPCIRWNGWREEDWPEQRSRVFPLQAKVCEEDELSYIVTESANPGNGHICTSHRLRMWMCVLWMDNATLPPSKKKNLKVLQGNDLEYEESRSTSSFSNS